MILSRSPYYIISDTLTPSVTSFDIELRIWKGNKVTDKPTDPTASFTVQRPSSETEKLSKNISPHIQDFFLNENTESFINPIVNHQDSIVWVDWVGVHTGDGTMTNVTGIDFATNGYTEFMEGLNSDNHPILMNSNQNGIDDKKMYDEGYLILPLLLDIDKSIQVEDANGSVEQFTVLANDDSDKQIYYYILDLNGKKDFINILTLDLNNNYARVAEYNFKIVCEKKFDPTNIVFKNKFGAFENIYFFKKPEKTIDVDSTEFINNVSGGLPYSTSSHQYKKFGVQAKQKLKCMTGYVSDYLNENMKQLMLSESVFIQESDRLIPVNVDTSNLNFKTQLVNQKVNYEIEFEYAYNQINSM